MILQALIFYLFAFVAVGAGVMVIVARNPVHSVLFLILTFFNAAGLFVLMGAEFLAMLLVVVYVGAVAVLFLFVVMMLEIDFIRLREGFLQYMPVGGLLGLVLLAELVVVIGGYFMAPAVAGTHGALAAASAPVVGDITNTEALGRLLYTEYVYIFQAAGLVLLVAMVGAIVLTLRHREVRRQRISDQVSRRPGETVELVKVPTGSGV
ncbi:MAG: NADH-quinone oxidoreductase subunit J [Alphaproteobacteria bacterium]|jgi:NADH-quinone oxidoreductase subunit J|nr:NADH-quinone oxidoreductase subunit J [Alphaproteobacteria bacterium]MDH5558561.1 NADH-quinone oxidoreductase subunit J [Alphaproteobacteria bacterium]